MKRTSSFVLQMLAGVAAAGASYVFNSQKQRLLGEGRRPDGRVVLITGGSRGLGLALAERYARAGNRLVLAARNFEDLVEARNTLLKRKAARSADDLLLIPADLTDPAQAANLVEHAISHFGRIDVLINNAGIIQVGPFENQSRESFESAMATNFYSALYTIQAALPHMLYRDRRRPAAIVNIGSLGGKIAMPHVLPYVASKFALVGFSEGLHAELRHKGVRVTTVCPGLMRTGGHNHASFVGDRRKEERWFDLVATTPVVAASVKCAARRIYNAVAEGRAEITITPQAWLAARMMGVAPETTQRIAALANEFVLPAPVASGVETHGREAGRRSASAPWNSEGAEQPVM